MLYRKADKSKEKKPLLMGFTNNGGHCPPLTPDLTMAKGIKYWSKIENAFAVPNPCL
jgi:hypothetical protein